MTEASPAPATTPRRRRRILAIGGGVLVLVLGGAYGAAYAMVGDTLARDASVAGVEVGGLSREEAIEQLETELAEQADTPIPLDAGEGGSFTLTPSEAGLGIDVAATVEDLPGGSANPLDLVQALFSGGEADPVVTVDRDELEAALTAVAGEADAAPVDGSVSFAEASVAVEEPVVGRSVQVPAAADLVEQRYTETHGGTTDVADEPVVLPVEDVPPAIDAAEVERAVTELAEPAMSGPITVTAGETTTEVPTTVLSQALSMSAGDGGLSLVLDPEALVEAADEQLAELGQSSRDARVVIEGGEPVVQPSATGLAVDPGDFATAVEGVITATGDDRAVTVELTETEPELTTEQAAALGVKEVVAEYTTEFPHAEYRNVNIGRAAEKINNTFLAPGDVFSLNDIVGERTEANGFTSGTIISDGRFRDALGGGVSQVATTVYNAAFFAGLKDVEHKAHSFYISRYPEGREATVAWPSVDLAFENDSKYGVVVQSVFSRSSPGSNGSLSVRIWSTEHRTVETSKSGRYNIRDFETIRDSGDDCVPQGGTVGFDVTVNRVVREGGNVIVDEDIVTRYNPAAAISCS